MLKSSFLSYFLLVGGIRVPSPALRYERCRKAKKRTDASLLAGGSIFLPFDSATARARNRCEAPMSAGTACILYLVKGMYDIIKVADRDWWDYV